MAVGLMGFIDGPSEGVLFRDARAEGKRERRGQGSQAVVFLPPCSQAAFIEGA
jgi:hypothetical protein